MSVAADHRTVSLWPLNTPAATSGKARRKALSTDPLAAITSRYRRGRAGIIAGDSYPPAVPTHLPTVPVALVSGSPLPEAAPPASADGAPTFWSRLVRSRRPTPRGRHSLKV
jgi:hypothetical protein